MHFESILAPIGRDEVMRRLRQYIPGNGKGAGRAFETTRTQLEIATQRAESLAERFTPYTHPEPYTGIVDLVKLLTTLRA